MKKYLFLLLIPALSFGQFNPIFFAPNISIRAKMTAYYKLDNDIVDATGLSPTGTGTNITYTTGKTGSAAVFDSGTDRIDIPDTTNLSFTDNVNDIPFSISFWVYFTGFNSGGNWLFDKGNGTSGSHEYQILRYTDGKIYVTKFDKFNVAIFQQAATVSTSYALNTWYHIVVTDNGTKTFAGMRMWVNGVSESLSDSSAGVYSGFVNGPAPARVGISPSASTFTGSVHQGYIEDIGVWKNRVLGQSEILYLYNSGNGRTYPFN